MFLSLFSVLTTIIMASNKQKAAVLSGFSLIIISALLNYLLIPIFQLKGAAIATTITAFIGMVILSFCVIKKYNSFVEIGSMLKIIFAAVTAYFSAKHCLFSGLYLVITFMIFFAVYGIILLMLREIKKEDIDIFKNIISS